MPAPKPQVVIVTGASRGIGHASAVALRSHGHQVVATARAVADLDDLVALGCRALPLDVTDAASSRAAVENTMAEFGRIDVLVNNAGYGLYGPIESQPLEEVRRQFETNVFGPAGLIGLVLPHMRAAGRGRIVNVTSMGGRTTLPGGGYYHASKYALEALSDVLRLEVAPFGIGVVLIEPGPVRTAWTVTALSSVATAESGEDDDPYANYSAAVGATMAGVDSGPIPWFASRPEQIAKVIVRAIERRRPRTRYLINPAAKSLVALRAVLPDRLYDAAMRRQYRIPGPRRPKK